MDKVWVAELENGEIRNEAVSAVAGDTGCGCCEMHRGRDNLLAPKTGVCWWMTSCCVRLTALRAW
jgi:hypothetical protein